MSETYVLILGAWHPGWVCRPVAERLRAAGHHAIALTLPGPADGDDRRGLRHDRWRTRSSHDGSAPTQ